MPRIAAPTVADHVAHQDEAIFAAAIGLFLEHGYANVSLADIASAVGLARNSLYRYVPDKAQLMVRWFRAELPVQVEAARRTLDGTGSVEERLARYVERQLDYAATPAHALIASLVEVVPTLREAQRQEFLASHRELLAPFNEFLAAAGVADPTLRSTVADLTNGLIGAVAGREQRTGPDPGARALLVGTLIHLLTTTKEQQP